MRWVRWVLYLLAGLIVLAGIYLIFLIGRSFPQEDGEIAVAGLRASVEVIRDANGLPHIYAQNTHDLFFAQGYVTAQDRFWQMDTWRHIGAGRLSELFGSSQVETDMFLRALGLVELAEEELQAMSTATRETLQWYADGVNAYLADHNGSQVSFEYAVLGLQNSGYDIEPWTPINTLTWGKIMSWDLSGNLSDELARAFLSKNLPVERVEQLYPPYPPDHPVVAPTDQATARARTMATIPDDALVALGSAARAAQRLWSVTGGGFEGIGSNNWVIGGSHTETGMPLLANDPHLAHQIPSIWYQVGLHCMGPEADCVQDRVGFTFPGVPGIVTGHNESIAWGVTNQTVDTQDLFIERVNPDDPDQYEVDGEWVDMEIREETIDVAGGDTVTYEIRATRHGPVISGLYVDDDQLQDGTVELPDPYVVALAWQSLEPSTLVEAVVGLNEATDYEAFRAAASLWDIAAQNLVYADVEGNIAYQSTGEVPLRANGDGRYPVPGWDSRYEWTGLVPFDEMPYLYNPPRDYVASANQPITEDGVGPFESYDGAAGFRAARIEELIQGSSRHSMATVQRMQMDAFHGGAADLMPFLLGMPADSEEDRELQEHLKDFAGGYQTAGSSAGAAVFNAVYRHLVLETFYDELPADFEGEYSVRMAGGNLWIALAGLMESPEDPWWDDIRTTGVETRDDILRRVFDEAHVDLVEHLGSDQSRWSWGRLHLGVFENQTLGQSGIAPIEWLLNRSVPSRLGGGFSIIQANGWRPEEGYGLTWVPSYRMVVDLADFDRSTWVNPPGSSGHVFHRHYDDMLEAWVDGVQHPMPFTRSEVEANAETTLTLLPG